MIHCEKYKATHSASTCIARLKALQEHDKKQQAKGNPKKWGLTGRTITDSRFEGCRECLEKLPDLIKKEEARLKYKKTNGQAPDDAHLKYCPRCGQYKSIEPGKEEFYKNKSRKDGFQEYCKECQKAYMAKSQKKAISKSTHLKDKKAENSHSYTPDNSEPVWPDKTEQNQPGLPDYMEPGRIQHLPPGTEPRSKIITVDLTNYPDVYDRIKEIAREEERTVHAQVRYWLRTGEFLEDGFFHIEGDDQQDETKETAL